MDTKKIIIGLVGGAVAGYVYTKYVAKKTVKTVEQGVKEVVEEGEEMVEKSIGGGGGGGFMPTTEVAETPTETKPASTESTTTKPMTSPVKEEATVSTKPLVYTKPAPTTTTTTTTKPTYSLTEMSKTKEITASKFSGIGGDKWEADIDNLDI